MKQFLKVLDVLEDLDNITFFPSGMQYISIVSLELFRKHYKNSQEKKKERKKKKRSNFFFYVITTLDKCSPGINYG